MSDDENVAGLHNLSYIGTMSDEDLIERHGRLARLEREEFHRHLSPMSFLGTASHLMNPALDDARWAVEKEMKRRHLWPPTNAQ